MTDEQDRIAEGSLLYPSSPLPVIIAGDAKENMRPFVFVGTPEPRKSPRFSKINEDALAGEYITLAPNESAPGFAPFQLLDSASRKDTELETAVFLQRMVEVLLGISNTPPPQLISREDMIDATSLHVTETHAALRLPDLMARSSLRSLTTTSSTKSEI